jgi:hypothetical protein
VNQLIIHGHAVKTLESKETKASKKITVTHNSVFAAHRLQCRMTNRKIDIRHFVFRREISGGCVNPRIESRGARRGEHLYNQKFT